MYQLTVKLCSLSSISKENIFLEETIIFTNLNQTMTKAPQVFKFENSET